MIGSGYVDEKALGILIQPIEQLAVAHGEHPIYALYRTPERPYVMTVATAASGDNRDVCPPPPPLEPLSVELVLRVGGAVDYQPLGTLLWALWATVLSGHCW
jgi:hypothetical protein